MGVPKPLSKEQAPLELHKIYDDMVQEIGHMPNFFGVMARFPAALKAFMQFFNTVMSEGTVGAKYKELAYVKASQVNGCEY